MNNGTLGFPRNAKLPSHFWQPRGVQRRWLDKSREIFSVKDQGAKGNGRKDDRKAIQDTIFRCAEKGGGFVLIPAGRYRVRDPLVISSGGIWIIAEGHSDGAEGTAIIPEFGDDHVFNFIGSFIGGGIRDLGIFGPGEDLTAGAGVKVDDAGNIKVENLRILGTYVGVDIDMGVAGGTVIRNVDTAHVGNTSFNVQSCNLLTIESCSTFQDDEAPGDSGIRISNGAGIRIRGFNSSNHANGLSVEAGNGQTIVDVWVSDCDFDSSALNATRIAKTGTGEVREVMLSNCRYAFSDNGAGNGRGILIDGGEHITVLGGHVVKNVLSGVRIISGTDLKFIGVDVSGNNVSDGVGEHGYDISGGDGIQIIGGKAGTYTDGLGNSDNQRRGINIQAGFTGHLTVRGVDLRGNVDGPILNASSSAFIDIGACQGHHMPWQLAVKLNEEQRNTTTFSDDGALQFPMAANTAYAIRGRVHFDSDATGDFKYTFNGPTGAALIRISRRHVDPSALTTLVTGSDLSYGSIVSVAGGAGTDRGFLEFDILVYNGANAGTFAFRWAQNAASGGSSFLRAGSYLEYRPV